MASFLATRPLLDPVVEDRLEQAIHSVSEGEKLRPIRQDSPCSKRTAPGWYRQEPSGFSSSVKNALQPMRSQRISWPCFTGFVKERQPSRAARGALRCDQGRTAGPTVCTLRGASAYARLIAAPRAVSDRPTPCTAAWTTGVPRGSTPAVATNPAMHPERRPVAARAHTCRVRCRARTTLPPPPGRDALPAPGFSKVRRVRSAGGAQE
eukprot:scaffold2088_cov399-Prasinococcus_capsulatus_cf.AAC.42